MPVIFGVKNFLKLLQIIQLSCIMDKFIPQVLTKHYQYFFKLLSVNYYNPLAERSAINDLF